MDLRNLKFLHLIRGFAAFFVILAHAKWPFWIGGAEYLSRQSFWQLNFIDKLGFLLALCTSNGTAMVIVFFVLSGFMIAHSYQKNQWSYSQFLVNRSLRIYIPYIASIALAGVLLVCAYGMARPIYETPLKDYHHRVAVAYSEGLTISNLIQTLLFFRSGANYYGFNYVYWSLLYEMTFYLLFPLILRYYKPILLTSALMYPLHFLIDLPEMQFFYIYFFIKFLFYFAAGVWLYQRIKSRAQQHAEPFFLRKGLLQLIVSGSFAGIIITGFLLPKGISFVLATVMSITWIIYILKYGVRHNLLSKAFLFLGEISYSLYLVHVPILLFFYSALYAAFGVKSYVSPWTYLLVVLFVLPLAWLFYVAFEKFSFQLIQKHKKLLHKPVLAPEPIHPSKEM